MAKRKQTKSRTQVAGQLAATSEKFLAGFSGWIGKTFRHQSKDFNILLGITLVLVAVGTMMVLSASYVDAVKSGGGAYSIFLKQGLAAIAGLLLMGFASRVPSFGLQKLAQPFFVFALGLQVAVLAIGTASKGNKNWINIFGLSIQPSEFLKLAMVIYISALLARRDAELDIPKRTWFPALGVGVVAMVLVIAGSDLGTVIIMFLMVLVQLSVAGMPRRIVGTLTGLAAVVIPIAVNSNASRAARVAAWLNPSAPDPNDVNWQSKHGIWALASGGLGGTGLGESKMKWSWIPEVENDFIFAIIGEELGLVGAIVVIALFIGLGFALIKIIMNTHGKFERYVVMGVLAWIVIQAIINIAVVIGFLPVLGVPLPLISSGGSSLLSTLAAIGIALGVERQNSQAPLRRKPIARKAPARR